MSLLVIIKGVERNPFSPGGNPPPTPRQDPRDPPGGPPGGPGPSDDNNDTFYDAQDGAVKQTITVPNPVVIRPGVTTEIEPPAIGGAGPGGDAGTGPSAPPANIPTAVQPDPVTDTDIEMPLASPPEPDYRSINDILIPILAGFAARQDNTDRQLNMLIQGNQTAIANATLDRGQVNALVEDVLSRQARPVIDALRSVQQNIGTLSDNIALTQNQVNNNQTQLERFGRELYSTGQGFSMNQQTLANEFTNQIFGLRNEVNNVKALAIAERPAQPAQLTNEQIEGLKTMFNVEQTAVGQALLTSLEAITVDIQNLKKTSQAQVAETQKLGQTVEAQGKRLTLETGKLETKIDSGMKRQKQQFVKALEKERAQVKAQFDTIAVARKNAEESTKILQATISEAGSGSGMSQIDKSKVAQIQNDLQVATAAVETFQEAADRGYELAAKATSPPAASSEGSIMKRASKFFTTEFTIGLYEKGKQKAFDAVKALETFKEKIRKPNPAGEVPYVDPKIRDIDWSMVGRLPGNIDEQVKGAKVRAPRKAVAVKRQEPAQDIDEDSYDIAPAVLRRSMRLKESGVPNYKGQAQGQKRSSQQIQASKRMAIAARGEISTRLILAGTKLAPEVSDGITKLGTTVGKAFVTSVSRPTLRAQASNSVPRLR